MIFWIIATICAFFIKGLCGFANTLVFTSVMGFSADNIMISPVELMLGYPTNMIISYKNRKSIDLKICIPLSLMVLAGSLVGIFFLKNVDTGLAKIICGAAIVLVGIEMLLRETTDIKIGNSKVFLTVVCLLAGILCGMYGIGALLGAYLGRVTKDTKSFKANICMIFIIENTFRIICYFIYGIITFEALKRAALLAPFMLLGLAGGTICCRFIDEKLAKRLVVIMLIISGLALVFANL